MSIVWARFPGGGSKLLTMLALADYGDDAGARIYPSMETLAAKTRMSERQIRRIVGDLVKEKYLVLEAKASGGKHKTNRYRIDLETLSNCPVWSENVRDMTANPDTGDRKPGHSCDRQTVRTVNNNSQDNLTPEQTPVTWGTIPETKIIALSAYVRQLEAMPENIRAEGELERARGELHELKLQAGEM